MGAARLLSEEASLTLLCDNGLAGGDPDDESVVTFSEPNPPREDIDDIRALLGDCEVESPEVPVVDPPLVIDDDEPLRVGPTVRAESVDNAEPAAWGDVPLSS